jgi:hypothetical protein
MTIWLLGDTKSVLAAAPLAALIFSDRVGFGRLRRLIERHQRIPLDSAEGAHLPLPQEQSEEQHRENDAEQGGQQKDFHGGKNKGWSGTTISRDGSTLPMEKNYASHALSQYARFLARLRENRRNAPPRPTISDPTGSDRRSDRV